MRRLLIVVILLSSMVALTIGQRVAEDRMIHNMVAGDIVVEEVISSTSDDKEKNYSDYRG